jgi:Heterokaryon incompatibility protein (HET)
MRLLHTTSLSVEVMKHTIPRYAILSHTWDETELSLQDLTSENCQSKAGYPKIQKSCEKARERNNWIWIDACCIDKTSSAELSEAINSMYRWYEDSDVCHVYLADFEGEKVSFHGLKKCK